MRQRYKNEKKAKKILYSSQNNAENDNLTYKKEIKNNNYIMPQENLPNIPNNNNNFYFINNLKTKFNQNKLGTRFINNNRFNNQRDNITNQNINSKINYKEGEGTIIIKKNNINQTQNIKEDEISYLKAQIIQLRKRLENIEHQFYQFKTIFVMTKNDISKKRDNLVENNNYNSINEIIKKLNKKLEENSKEFENYKTKKENSINKILSEIESLKTKINDNNKYKVRLEGFRSAKEKNKLSEIKNEKETVIKQLEILNSKYIELKINNEEIKEQKEELKNKYKEIKEQIEELIKQKKEIKEQIEKLIKQKKDIKGQENELIKKNREITIYYDEFKKINEELKKQNSEIQKNNEDLKKQNKELKTQINGITNFVEESKKKIEELIKENEDLRKQNKKLNEEYKKQNGEIKKLLGEIIKQNEELNKQQIKQKDELKKQNEDILKLKEKIYVAIEKHGITEGKKIIKIYEKKYANVGLINLGNKCYMNSVLQIIKNIPQFVYNILKLEDNKDNFIIQLKNLLLNLCSPDISVYSPKEFIKYLCQEKLGKKFNGNNQYDSNIFYISLLNIIDNKLNLEKIPKIDMSKYSDKTLKEKLKIYKENDFSSKKETFIFDIFYIYFANEIKCDACKNLIYTIQKTNFIDFPIVTVDGKVKSLEECFDNYQKSKTVNETCIKCGSLGTIHKSIFLDLPPVLIINLKRVGEQSAYFNEIDIPHKLDIARIIKNFRDVSNSSYELRGFIKHEGDEKSGHNYAFCKNMFNNRWYEYNDSNCRCIENEPNMDKIFFLCYIKLGKDTEKINFIEEIIDVLNKKS